MSMKLIETTVSETSVHMQLGDDADPERASEWLEFEVPLAGLVVDAEKNPLGGPEERPLAIIQRAALHHAQGAISAEIARLAVLADRKL